jgi:hypothetical protein
MYFSVGYDAVFFGRNVLTFRKNELPPYSGLKRESSDLKSEWSKYIYMGSRDSLVVETLDYKPEGSGFYIRWGEILSLPNPSGCTIPWGLLSL